MPPNALARWAYANVGFSGVLLGNVLEPLWALALGRALARNAG